MRKYQSYVVRQWKFSDRIGTTAIISSVLAEYGMEWDPEGADRDVLDIDTYYLDRGGDFWVVEDEARQLVGTSAYYPSSRGEKAVEIRKMYLLPIARGQGLGRHLLRELERAITAKGYHEIWIETASTLTTAVKLYETHDYELAIGVETPRCDRVYMKSLAPRSMPDHR